MADAPKKDSKKEAPKVSINKNGHELLLEFIGFFVAVLILMTALSSSSFFRSVATDQKNTNGTSTQGSEGIPQGDLGFWQALFNSFGHSDIGSYPSPGKLAVGTQVITERLTQIRREPGGSVIGFQKRGEKAVLSDGPVSAYGTNWWMATYDSVPSGWVDEKDITTNIFEYYVVNFFPILWDYLKIIAWIVSGFFGIMILYIAVREPSVPLYDSDPVDIKPQSKSPSTLTATSSSPNNLPVAPVLREETSRWNHVSLLMKSHNPSDWKQAIIEADVMLDNMLDAIGYEGNSIGDKLKNAEEEDFKTLDKAWEAHKVRNRIAHDGGEYKFAYDEAARVVKLYEDVFKEFYYI